MCSNEPLVKCTLASLLKGRRTSVPESRVWWWALMSYRSGGREPVPSNRQTHFYCTVVLQAALRMNPVPAGLIHLLHSCNPHSNQRCRWVYSWELFRYFPFTPVCLPLSHFKPITQHVEGWMFSNPSPLNPFAPEEQAACFGVLKTRAHNQIAFLISFAEKRRCAAVKKRPRQTLAEGFIPLLLHTIMEL